MPSRRGFHICVLDPIGNATDRQIQTFTGDTDRIVAVSYNVGKFLSFSNSIFPGQVDKGGTRPAVVNITWDPPGDLANQPGPSQHTYFDNQPLSSRSEDYQQMAVNWFIDFVLASYLNKRHYVVEPTSQVIEALEGQLPKTVEDIAKLACNNPDLLNRVTTYEERFDPAQFSSRGRKICHALLENRESLERYLENPKEFVYQGRDIRANDEAKALIRAATEKPEAVRAAFDSVELGDARGDGNTYILIGVNPDTNLPDPASLQWLIDQLPIFVRANGFLPGFGCFITEARMRYHIVLGPGTGQREKDFLSFFGHEIIERYNGEPIGVLKSPPPDQSKQD